MRRAIGLIGIVAASVAMSVTTAPAAAADSGVRVVYTSDDGWPLADDDNSDCAGQWLSGPNDFRLKDGDLDDDDWCYIDYRLQGQTNTSRVSIPQDQSATWQRRHIKNPNAVPKIEFKVCQERQDDPDICLDWRSYET